MKKDIISKIIITAMAITAMIVTTAIFIHSSMMNTDIKASAAHSTVCVSSDNRHSEKNEPTDHNGKHPGECGYGYCYQ